MIMLGLLVKHQQYSYILWKLHICTADFLFLTCTFERQQVDPDTAVKFCKYKQTLSFNQRGSTR